MLPELYDVLIHDTDDGISQWKGNICYVGLLILGFLFGFCFCVGFRRIENQKCFVCFILYYNLISLFVPRSFSSRRRQAKFFVCFTSG
jgi:hypothetical protein